MLVHPRPWPVGAAQTRLGGPHAAAEDEEGLGRDAGRYGKTLRARHDAFSPPGGAYAITRAFGIGIMAGGAIGKRAWAAVEFSAPSPLAERAVSRTPLR